MLRYNKIGTENLGSIWRVSAFKMNDSSSYLNYHQRRKHKESEWIMVLENFGIVFSMAVIEDSLFFEKHLDRNQYGSDY